MLNFANSVHVYKLIKFSPVHTCHWSTHPHICWRSRAWSFLSVWTHCQEYQCCQQTSLEPPPRHHHTHWCWWSQDTWSGEERWEREESRIEAATSSSWVRLVWWRVYSRLYINNNTLSTTFYTVQDKNIRPRSHNHTDAAKTQININLIVLQARDNFTTLSYYAETDDYWHTWLLLLLSHK